MPLDALFLNSLSAQLSHIAVGARVDKIQMPSRDDVVLLVRTQSRGNLRLLISIGTAPRVNFTNASYENPAQPPMFCMLLRKHLSGARLVSLTQPPMERLLMMEFDCRDELGRPCMRKLIVEMVPRRANIILVDDEGVIIDCLHRVDMEMSRRQVLPGLFYRLPPAPDKPDPLTCPEDEIRRLLDGAESLDRPDKVILDCFMGLSPAVCAELSWLSLQRRVPLADIVCELRRLPCEGYITKSEAAASDFSVIPLTCRGGESFKYDDLSELLETFYGEKTRRERTKNASRDIHRAVKNARDRASKRLEARKIEIVDAANREHLRVYGDIITSNIHRMGRGQNKLVAENYYEDECPEIEIPLDALLSPQQNAAKYYKEYTRRKTAEKYLTKLMQEDAATIDYLDSVLDELDRASGDSELAEIRTELKEAGIIKTGAASKKEARPKPQKPLVFTSPNGFEVMVGKNNRQNDQLTFKTASRGDLWFHTQKIHGSHVVLFTRGAVVPDEDIEYAAALAAGHSQAAESSNVPVDCALIKNVKKPAGSRAGFVIYDNFKTYFVDPIK
ncbi:MAG: NFACT family protein [Oscillospiraceae bacterium]|nr:NFACT family protein [Oscillospiraceae bacterium]